MRVCHVLKYPSLTLRMTRRDVLWRFVTWFPFREEEQEHEQEHEQERGGGYATVSPSMVPTVMFISA